MDTAAMVYRHSQQQGQEQNRSMEHIASNYLVAAASLMKMSDSCSETTIKNNDECTISHPDEVSVVTLLHQMYQHHHPRPSTSGWQQHQRQQADRLCQGRETLPAGVDSPPIAGRLQRDYGNETSRQAVRKTPSAATHERRQQRPRQHQQQQQKLQESPPPTPAAAAVYAAATSSAKDDGTLPALPLRPMSSTHITGAFLKAGIYGQKVGELEGLRTEEMAKYEVRACLCLCTCLVYLYVSKVSPIFLHAFFSFSLRSMILRSDPGLTC
jgi:hypothetical protein